LDAARTVIERELLADLPAMRKMVQQVPKAEPVIVAPRAVADLAKLADRLGKTWNSKKHSQAISAMLDKLKGALKFKSSPDTDAAWEKLVQHATDYCCSAIHAEAGEETI
jgi:hypothetical protein